MRRVLRLRYLLPAIVLLLILGRIGLHYGAEVTIKGAFYDALGMGDVYSTRWHASIALAAIGLGIALLLSLPVLLVGREPGRRRRRRPRGPQPVPQIGPVRSPDDPAGDPSDPRGDIPRRPSGPFGGRPQIVAGRIDRNALRLGVRIAWLATFAILAGILAPGLEGSRDRLLAWFESANFGVSDPIFGRDVGFFIFSEPALSRLASLAASALGVAATATIAVGFGIWFVERQRDRWRESAAALSRTMTIGFALGGLFLLSTAAIMWLSRYRLTTGGDDVVAGAGAAVRGIDIPTRTVGAIALAILALALIALAVPALRRRVALVNPANASIVGLGVWGAIIVALVIFADPWWLVLAVPFGVAVVLVRKRRARIRALRLAAPLWAWPAFAGLTAIVLSVIGPVGAALNDGLVLRGSQLQVERENIEATLMATRRASGIDKATITPVDYRPNGVTTAAIEAAPASVGSLRFLDIPPTREACSREETRNQFYVCQDVDIDRYPVREQVDEDDPPTVVFTDGRRGEAAQRRTVFSVGREIDYSKVPDFQRRHFTYTHGFGLIMAPVDRIDLDSGRPVWIAGGLPQRGLRPELTRAEIYFGAQPGMPWAMVNTDQPEFDRTTNRRIEWTGGTGIEVGSGWRRLALTTFLGGLPYVGGGRRLWNATSGRPADKDSQAILYRDIDARVAEMAPFLSLDSDPFFTAADERLYVVAPAYVASDRYPYAARFGGGVSYARQSVTVTMDAYSGETRYYVMDPDEPIIKTWMRVYPDLFTPLSEMPDALRQHLRYGEDLFEFQSQALGRFHVTSTDAFFNGDEAWTPTEEAYGPGVEGERIVSPARYTYAVLPEETQERFLAIRSYKPLARGRGIGFSGWLAASNEPDDFGKLTVLEFPTNADDPLDSLDTFTSNVARDPELSAEIGVRRDTVLRGNTIVVPIGEGLLYVQPLYLDSPDDSLPTLWQVIVSFGNGRVYAAPSFQEAVSLALRGRVAPPTGPQPPTGPPPPPVGPGDPPPAGTVEELVAQASDAFDAYQAANASGDYAEAGRQLARVRELLSRAKELADARDGGAASPPSLPPSSPAASPPAPPPPPTP